jgi:GTP-binding protein HflX
LVYNKGDLLDSSQREHLEAQAGAVVIAAASGEGLQALLQRIAVLAAQGGRHMTVLIPYNRGDLVGLAHDAAHVLSEEHTAEGTLLTIVAPAEITQYFEAYERTSES